MATEYVLVSKHKYELLGKNNNQLRNEGKSLQQGEEQLNNEEGGSRVDAPNSTCTTGTDGNKVDRDFETSARERNIHMYAKRSGKESSENREDRNYAEYYSDSPDSDADNDYDVADIMQAFTSSELKYIKPLINLIKEQEDILTWDNMTGEIVLHGKPINNTNIVALLKDTLSGKIHPVGKMEFLRGLDILEVNLKLIKDRKSRELIKRAREHEKKISVKGPKPRRMKPVKDIRGWISWK